MYFSNFVIHLLCFFSSLITNYIIFRYFHPTLIKNININNNIQKIHSGNVARIGGLSIFLSLIVACITFYFTNGDFPNILLLLFIICGPVFLVGFLEDFTQNILPKYRLVGALITALLFIFLSNNVVTKTGFDIFDKYLEIRIISLIFTLICMVFLIQSFNIIDGLNGLSSITFTIIILTISTISYLINDIKIFNLSNLLILIMLGFIVFNFPYGKVFLGDSGAYLIGALSSVLLIEFNNNNNGLSPLVIVQIVIYPSYELLRTVFRRALIQKSPITEPDMKHLHSLLYLYHINFKSKTALIANFTSSSKILILNFINCIYIINFFNNQNLIIFGIISFIVIYEIIYYFLITKIKLNKKI